MYKKLTLSFLALSIPVSAFAQVTDFLNGQALVYDIFVSLSSLFWAMAVAFFVWGIIKFIKNADDTAEHEKGKQFMVWGIIAFLVLVSLWGLVRLFLVDTLGITPMGAPDYVDKNGVIIPT